MTSTGSGQPDQHFEFGISVAIHHGFGDPSGCLRLASRRLRSSSVDFEHRKMVIDMLVRMPR